MVILLTKEESNRYNKGKLNLRGRLGDLMAEPQNKITLYLTRESDQFILELTVETYIDIIK